MLRSIDLEPVCVLDINIAFILLQREKIVGNAEDFGVITVKKKLMRQGYSTYVSRYVLARSATISHILYIM